MTKAEARKLLEDLNLSPSQESAAQRTIKRATNLENIEVTQTDSGEVIIKRSRPGKVFGHQVFEDRIKADGKKEVVQWAYDDDGNLIHEDPKGGSP